MAVEVWWSSLVAADSGLLPYLDARERARVESLERPADRGRSLVGAALLRVAAADHLGVEPGQVVVDRTCTGCGGPHGAPRIVGSGEQVPSVSVSHSGVLVVVALGPDGPVGVDVQRVSDLPDPSAARDWVRREAAIKARSGASVAAGHAAAAGHGPVADHAADPVEVTTDLVPPLTGYAAALTTLGRPVTGHVDRHWP